MVWTDPNEVMIFTTDNEYWINRIIADAAKHPDEIKIMLMPSENNGSIKVKIPNKYLDVRPEQIVFLTGDESDGRST